MRIFLGLLALLAGLVALNARANSDSPVAAAARALEDNYVFPDLGRRMADHLRVRESAGAYAALTDPAELARVLTADIQSVNGDKHLRVRAPSVAGGPPRRGFGGPALARIEVLPGNIGYLDVRLFPPLPMVEREIAGAMQTVAGTRALLIDARRHRGGSPETVAFFCSYLFGAEPVHLNSLYHRATGRTTDFFTDPTVPGTRFGPDRPIYVLTSRTTFSAGEELCYNLQTRQRATLIGETTGGGANPGRTHALPGGFTVFVSNGRAINPITGTNWEGVGVKPEVPVPAAEAFVTAYRRALEGVDLAQLDAPTRARLDDLLQNPPTPQ